MCLPFKNSEFFYEEVEGSRYGGGGGSWQYLPQLGICHVSLPHELLNYSFLRFLCFLDQKAPPSDDEALALPNTSCKITSLPCVDNWHPYAFAVFLCVLFNHRLLPI